jgi:DNA end-binding protein Ku
VKVPAEMLKLAEHILDSKSADFDPTTFVDHYEAAMSCCARGRPAFSPPRRRSGA